MFGTENDFSKWNCCFVEDVADVTVGVVIKPTQYYCEKGIPAFRSLNIGEMKVNDSDWVYFTEEGNEKNRKSILKENDVLVVRSGAPGKSCVITKKYEGYNVVDAIIAHPNLEKVNPVFLCMFTNMPHGMNQIKAKTGGAAQQHFNVGGYNSLKIILPPLSLQNDFSAFVHQIDKSKFEMAIYEKLWYNYQIWRKKMGLFRGILDLFSTWTISDKLGLGAGFLYADYAWEKANERELNKMKAGVTQTISNYINENRKLLNNDLIQTLNNYINSIANCNKFNANSILSELKNFLMHKCAYHSCIIEILNHSIEAIESIPEDNLDDGVKIQALQKTKNVIDCSDSNQLPILLKDLFSFYDENGIEVENKEELFDKFESLRKEYLA